MIGLIKRTSAWSEKLLNANPDFRGELLFSDKRCDVIIYNFIKNNPKVSVVLMPLFLYKLQGVIIRFKFMDVVPFKVNHRLILFLKINFNSLEIS